MTPAFPSPPSRLAAVAQALSLPTYRAPGCIGLHTIWRGTLRSLAAALTRAYVSHGETFGPDGMRIEIPGLVVEEGGMGGVMVREVGEHEGDEVGGSIAINQETTR